jgi:hypothetical protein
MKMEMMSAPANEPRQVLSHPKMKAAIERRAILPKDFSLTERLGSFPKNMLISGLHNMFGMYKEQSGKELARSAENATTPQAKEMYETALSLFEKYNWPASLDIERVLETI